MMNWRNLGCFPASFFNRLAIGLHMVFNASVPSLTTGSAIAAGVSHPFQLAIIRSSPRKRRAWKKRKEKQDGLFGCNLQGQ
jgi:hypothetical protein